MAISSLPKESKTNLIELSADLSDVLYEKQTVIEEASKLIDKMKSIEETQNKLDDKGSKIVEIDTPIEAKEFQDLLEKADKLSTEKNDIYKESKIINNRLNELNNIEKTIKDEINKLLEAKEQVEEIKNINIVSKKVPNTIDKINPDFDRIINSSITLSNYITDLSDDYLSNAKNSNVDSAYNELKQKVEEYENLQNESTELKLVEKANTIEFPKTVQVDEIVEKPVINDVIQEQVIEDTPIETNAEEEPITPDIEIPKPTLDIPTVNPDIPTVENINIPNEIEIPTVENINKPQDNVIPLSSVIENNAPQQSINSKVVKFNDKVVPNKVARATKKKAREVIMPKFDGTYPKTTVVTTLTPLSNSDVPQFNLDNFLNNKAA